MSSSEKKKIKLKKRWEESPVIEVIDEATAAARKQFALRL